MSMAILSDANAVMGGDLSGLIAFAAYGDVTAQRQGRETSAAASKASAERGETEMAKAQAFEASFWARFAAAHGHDDDAIALAIALGNLAEFWGYDREGPGAAYGNALLAEAAVILDRLAAGGHAVAAEGLVAFSRSVSPHILQRANEVAKEIADAGF